MKYLFLIMSACQFIIGVVDLYVDYDKFTFLWLITGVLYLIIGLYFSIMDKLKESK